MKNLPVSLILALLCAGCEVNLSLDDGRGDAGDPRISVPEAAGELREQIPVYKVSLPLEDADPDEPEDLERILAVAVDKEEIEKREVAGSGLLYLPGEPMPFSGWKRESHPDGRVKSLVRIRYGREDGPYRTWREDGAKASAGNYREGRRTGRYVRWGEGGEKEMETHYLNGSKNGPFVFWHPNGVKESEGNYTDDKMDGLFLRWTREGVPKERITYRDGKPDGLWITYGKDGSEWYRTTYRNGEMVSERALVP